MVPIYRLVQKILEMMGEKEGLPIHLGPPIFILLNWEDARKDGWSMQVVGLYIDKIILVNF